MKDRWESLTLREKQMVLLGSIIVFLFLIYALFLSPLNQAVNELKDQLQHKQELSNWMINADHRLEKRGQPSRQKIAAAESLLSTVQNALNQSPLATQVTQLRQMASDTVEINFQQVEFDQLMQLLLKLENEQEIVISQLSATPTTRVGDVNAVLVLKKS